MTFGYIKGVVFGVALVAGSVAAQAEPGSAYKPSQFLTLDLKAALLSPKRLGPAASFEAYPIEARADTKNALDAQADKPVAQRAVPAAKPQRKIAARSRPHSNPLDANAMDTRIQTWPCRTGGICNWRR